jgi:hypothetical protein
MVECSKQKELQNASYNASTAWLTINLHDMKHVWMIHFSCPSPNAKHIIVIIIIQVQN